MERTKYLRRVDLGGSYGGATRRGVDETLSVSVLGEGALHGAQESRRAMARVYGVRAPRAEDVVDQDELGLDDLRLFDIEQEPIGLQAELDALAFGASPRLHPVGLGVDVERLAYGVGRVLWSHEVLDFAAERVGVISLDLLEAATGVSRILAKATRRSAPEPTWGAQSLFGGAELECPRVSDDKLVELTAVWAAREVASRYQRSSDADVARLLIIQEAIEAEIPLPALLTWKELCRWSTGIDPFGGVGADGDRLRARADSMSWDAGLARVWAVLQEEQLVAALAWERFVALARGEVELGHQAELIGLTSLWAPTFAHTLMRQVNAGAHLDPGRVARYVPRPAPGFASAHIAVLREIARRRGWQTSDIEELSFTEQTLRPIRRNGIPLDVVIAFAMTGDPSAIVELMGQVDPMSGRTRYTLLVEEPDEHVAAVTAYGRAVYERLAAEALDVRPSFAAGVFWRYPKVTIASGTELHGL